MANVSVLAAASQTPPPTAAPFATGSPSSSTGVSPAGRVSTTTTSCAADTGPPSGASSAADTSTVQVAISPGDISGTDGALVAEMTGRPTATFALAVMSARLDGPVQTPASQTAASTIMPDAARLAIVPATANRMTVSSSEITKDDTPAPFGPLRPGPKRHPGKASASPAAFRVRVVDGQHKGARRWLGTRHERHGLATDRELGGHGLPVNPLTRTGASASWRRRRRWNHQAG